MKKIFVLLGMLVFSTFANSAGWEHHGTSQGVSLYYKVSDYGVTFKVKNNTDRTVHVVIQNMSGRWSDGRTRTEDVYVTYANPNQTATGSYDHADNYSKLESWSFSGWRWSTRRSDLN